MCKDTSLDGVLVQLPLPPHIREEPLVDSIAPSKDVDGFHPLNIGRTLMRGRRATFVPCTALGVMQLLGRSNVQLAGCNVVILGDSNIVGMPLAMLFRDGGAATVTVVHRTSYGELFADAASEERAAQRAEAGACHPRLPGFLSGHAVGEEKGSNTSSATASPTPPPPNPPPAAEPYEVTYSANLRDAYRWKQRDVYSSSSIHTNSPGPDLPAITSTADILVVAVGYPGLVKRGWVKPGAVVVDVGINVVDWESSDSRGEGGRHNVRHDLAGGKSGGDGGGENDGLFHVVGDVDFEDVGGIASAITPVPGGVGPMTVAALMHNTVEAAKEHLGIKMD
jgi:5,10-methylene-tetrahydrofolate dehydrogenase/methenyl tetrahydrofolate cyclohydrolase